MMFPGSRSCINLVSRVVRLLTHIDDARAYIVPYLHRRFIPRHLAPTVGLGARGFIIRWVQSSSTTAASSSPHRSSDSDIKIFFHTGRRARQHHCPCDFEGTASSLKLFEEAGWSSRRTTAKRSVGYEHGLETSIPIRPIKSLDRPDCQRLPIQWQQKRESLSTRSRQGKEYKSELDTHKLHAGKE